MMSLKMDLGRIALLTGLVFAGTTAPAQSGRTNTPKPDRTLAQPALTNSPATPDYQPINFDRLAAFPIKVDWLINPTNSSLDKLKVEGNIPDDIKSLHEKKVALHGFMKPLKQDARGATEFLLMRDHALCCQTNVPKINEWVHVRMSGKSLPFVHERTFTVWGVLYVGELQDAGNVVSVYRLAGSDILAVAESR